MRKEFICAVVVLMIVIAPETTLAKCDKPATAVQLFEAGVAGETAFANLSAEALLTQSTLARSQILPCLTDILTIRDAAAFHRLMALEAFINGDNSRTIAELHASLKLEPGFSFSEEVAGIGHPILALYSAAAFAQDGEAEPVFPPKGGYAMVAGVRNAPRYELTPAIVQVFSIADELLETRYVQPGEAMPKWGINAFGLTAQDIGIKRNVPDDPRAWFAAGGATLALSGVFYAIAMWQRNTFEDPMTPDDDLALYEARANGIGAAGMIAAGTGFVFTGFGIGFQISIASQQGKNKETHND